MRSPRKEYYERVLSLCRQHDRFVDIACQLVVYKRGPDGTAVPDYELPKVYGGKYDRMAKRYVGPADTVAKFSVSPSQVEFLTCETAAPRVLAIGAQGGGKTEMAILAGVLFALETPNGIGLVVAPDRDKTNIAWDKFLALVQPHGWVDDIRKADNQVILVNRQVVNFRGAKRSGKSDASPIVGLGAQWVVEDEQAYMDDVTIREVNARGRIAKNFRVRSTATNEPNHRFQLRLSKWRTKPEQCKIITVDGYANVFTSLEHWDRFKSQLTEPEFDRYVRGLDIPADGRVYPAFSSTDSIRAIPQQPQIGSLDVTREITAAKYQQPFEYIVGLDFGRTVTAAVVAKAFKGTGRDERLWYLTDEITVRDRTTDYMGRQLLERFGGDPSRFVVIADPHGQPSPNNAKEVDRSDYVIFRRMGINIFPASYSRISRKHRYSMVNALLRDANGVRRLFVARDASGAVRCDKTVESMTMLMYGPNDEPETHDKGSRGGEDLTHYTDDVGYLLFPFESFRGSMAKEPQKEEAGGLPYSLRRR